MGSERLSLYRDRVRRALTAAFEEEHTDREIAASFALGIFITAMPTGGLGIGLFFVFAYYWSWVSKTAIFASVVVLNPLVKPLVYVASYKLGTMMLGTEQLLVIGNSFADAILMIVQFVLFGNVLIALFLSAVSYVLVLHLTREYRRHVGKRSDSSSLPITASTIFWRRK